VSKLAQRAVDYTNDCAASADTPLGSDDRPYDFQCRTLTSIPTATPSDNSALELVRVATAQPLSCPGAELSELAGREWDSGEGPQRLLRWAQPVVRFSTFLYAAKRPKWRGVVEKKNKETQVRSIGADIQRIGSAGDRAGKCSRNALVLCGLDRPQGFQRPFSVRQLYG
jgi:hypothetical protein